MDINRPPISVDDHTHRNTGLDLRASRRRLFVTTTTVQQASLVTITMEGKIQGICDIRHTIPPSLKSRVLVTQMQ